MRTVIYRKLRLLLMFFFLVVWKTTIAQPSGKELIRQSIEAMGGQTKLENLKTVRVESFGHVYRLEQSERPEGPWLVQYEKGSELIDFEHGRQKKEADQLFLGVEDWIHQEIIFSKNAGMKEFFGRKIPMAKTSIEKEKEKWMMLPDRALLAANKSQNVTFLETARLQGVDHYIVSYEIAGKSYLLFINANTHLPTAIETKRSSYVDIWGQINYRTYFSYWDLLPGGIRYPKQIDTYHDNQPYKTKLFTKIECNPEIQDDDFAIPKKIEKASMNAKARDWRSRPLGWQREPIKVIASGVIMIPGSWYSTIVKQPDGLVIIEAPISSEYSEKIIAEAERRFPNMPIKAVINTSDSWPHLGGIRAYVARGIPVYTHALNKKILTKLVAANYKSRPDSLQKNPVKPQFRGVSGKKTIGEGKNRLELYPIQGEGAERMVMVYLPDKKLLYGSDLIQHDQEGNLWNLQYVSELKQAVNRENLNVKIVYAMHTSTTVWDSVMSELDEFLRED